MSLPAVPMRTPMYDAKGNLSRTWILFFESLGTAQGAAATTTNPPTVVANVANTFTPDLGAGSLVLLVVLTADSVLNAPINGFAGERWTLIIDQDATGGWNLVFDPTYFYSANLLGTVAKSTRAQSQWLFDGAGNNSLSGTPSTDQPIPA